MHISKRYTHVKQLVLYQENLKILKDKISKESTKDYSKNTKKTKLINKINNQQK